MGKGTVKDISNPAKAFFYASKSAEQGNLDGIVLMGSVYLHGEGTPVDTYKAFEYYLKASNLGHRAAMHCLSMLYQDGVPGVEKDLVKAFCWTKKSAENGFELAFESLADMYRDGRGCAVNVAEADRWDERHLQNRGQSR
jgi:TPR repeat protein